MTTLMHLATAMCTLMVWHQTVFALDCYKCIPSTENSLCYHLQRDAQVVACSGPDERCFKASGDMVLQDYSKASFQLSMCITQRQLNTLDAEFANDNKSSVAGRSDVSASLQEQACQSGPQAELLMRYFFRQTEEAYDRPMRAEVDFASEVLPGTIHNPSYCQCQSDLCNTAASSLRFRARRRNSESIFYQIFTFLLDFMPLTVMLIISMLSSSILLISR